MRKYRDWGLEMKRVRRFAICLRLESRRDYRTAIKHIRSPSLQNFIESRGADEFTDRF